jgi:hypothetical protein
MMNGFLLVGSKLTRLVVVSSMIVLWALTVASAHEVRPSVADVTITPQTVDLRIRLTAESLLAGVDLSQVQDTNEAPQAAQYDMLRTLPAEDLAARFRAEWPVLVQRFDLRAGDVRLDPQLIEVRVTPEADIEVPRDTEITLKAELPEGDAAITVAWGAEFGALVIRQMGAGEDAYTGYLDSGARSEALPRQGTLSESASAVFARYIPIGFAHIIPKGLDHILFVLGLFFFSLHVRPLLMQITAFTLAHTVTLAMASLGLVTVPASIVEPLIAASIVYVAVENILRPTLGWWRTAVVFGFGLLHGLGFASVLGEVGLDPARFVVGLIGFNVGVELGQLVVIALAFVTVGLWFGKRDWYRSVIAVPASVVIACVGAFWVVERTLL